MRYVYVVFHWERWQSYDAPEPTLRGVFGHIDSAAGAAENSVAFQGDTAYVVRIRFGAELVPYKGEYDESDSTVVFQCI